MKEVKSVEENLERIHNQLDNLILLVGIFTGISVFSFVLALVTLMRT